MPLTKGGSDKTRARNALEMIASGHPRDVSWAAAYREQRASKAKAPHRRHKMPESAGHGPGHEITGEGDSVRQRHRMGEGRGTMAGDSFGVGPLPGTRTAQNHGAHAGGDGKHLADNERSGPPGIKMGSGSMAATAHSHHGPHGHR